MISNAGAGTVDQENLDAAVAVLRERCEVEVVSTSGTADLDQALSEAQARTIVIAGGDGSLHAVVNRLHGRGELADTVLGLIPLGTGNDFARSVGLPLEPADAARTLLTGAARRVDLIEDDAGEVVVNNVHVGAGAQASRRGDRWKRRLGSIGVGKVNLGKLGYPIGAVLAAVKPPFLRLRVEVDGRVVNDLDRPVLMVAVGNGQSVGGGTELTPEADAEDGRLDVMISRAIGPVSRFGYVASLGRGRHPDRDDVEYLHGRQIAVSGEEFYSAADGEIHGPLRGRTWAVRPRSCSMILP